MRLKLILQHRPNQVLPINYQYLISSWIYRTLGSADSEFAKHLHEHGYGFGGKKYKLFTFSSLRPNWFDLDKKNATFTLAKSPTVLVLSFYIDKALQHFVMGLFKDQDFELSSGSFRACFEVAGIDALSKPVFQTTMRFRTITPICVSRREEGKQYAHYLSPEIDGYGNLLIQNLLRKWGAAKGNVQVLKDGVVDGGAGLGDLLNFENLANPDLANSFRLLNKPKSKLISIKGTKIRGFLFDFEITAPRELLEIGFFGGFGEKNSSLGFGMLEILK